MKKYLVVLFLISSLLTNAQGFLRVNGIHIANDTTDNFIIRAVNLGGWLVKEGYIIQTAGFASTEHEFEQKLIDMLGVTKAAEVLQVYHENYVTEADIKAVADWGLNAIRLPLHHDKLISYSITADFIEAGFATIDSVLAWCEKYKIYLILDLHAAPGGQSYDSISDYDPNKLSLWESKQNRDATVALWHEMARRYSEREWIGGYDLINETHWDLGNNNEMLRQLFGEITDSIRSADTTHILFIEGNGYANDFRGLTPAWDENMVYSFHKYWSANDLGSISWVLSLRKAQNRPIWLGETGENSNAWITDMVMLVESNDIGWAFWPQKKIDSISGPLSADKTANYQRLLDYWNNGGSNPGASFAYSTLIDQFKKLNYNSVLFRHDVVDAMVRQPHTEEALPYKQHLAPGIIYASEYDLGRRGVAWQDKEWQQINQPGQIVWNTGWIYRNDGVDIEKCTDSNTNGYSIGWIDSGDWVAYTVNFTEGGTYTVNFRIAAAQTGGKIQLVIDDQFSAGLFEVPKTNGWYDWKTISFDNIAINKGTHKITLKFFFGGFNLNYFEFTNLVVDVAEEKEIPESFELYNAYPNPFNPSTTISFTLPEESRVKLSVFNELGEIVEILSDETLSAGHFSKEWDAAGLTSGIYFYKLQTDKGFSDTKKLILLK